MLAHDPATRTMGRDEYQGNVAVLIIGGNDTTRNTISGSVYWLNKNPDQYDKLRANPDLVPNMVSETIRYQTPLAHMSRVATRDVEIGGKTIKKGERVVMWYISGNRDESVIADPDVYDIDPRAAAPAHVVRFRRAPLCRQPRRRDAADHHLGGDPQALSGDRGDRRAGARLLLLRARLREHARRHSSPRLTSPSLQA